MSVFVVRAFIKIRSALTDTRELARKLAALETELKSRLHDVVTGEFANIGVVLYVPEQRFLEARFTTSYERLNAIFLKIDHLHFRTLMRYVVPSAKSKPPA